MSAKSLHTPEKARAVVLKFGGSFATDSKTGELQEEYFEKFFSETYPILRRRFDKVGLIVGGGEQAREQQKANEGKTKEELDKVPQELMWSNAEKLRQAAAYWGLLDVAPSVPKNPAEAKEMARLYGTVALNWLAKGQSTDASAAFLLQEFAHSLEKWIDPEGMELYNLILSNVVYMFQKNPDSNPDTPAVKLANYKLLLKEGILSRNRKKWVPGSSLPIDYVGVDRLARLEEKYPKFRSLYTDGYNSPAIRAFLLGKPFRGEGTFTDSDVQQIEYLERSKAIVHPRERRQPNSVG